MLVSSTQAESGREGARRGFADGTAPDHGMMLRSSGRVGTCTTSNNRS